MNKARRYAGIASDVAVGMRRPRGRSKGVLVLGMHRSGTSAITSVVSLLGPDLGDHRDLMAPSEANQRGYWESRRLTEFQESLLEKLGGDWETPPPLPPGWERNWRLVRRIGLARRVFGDVYGGAEQWVWKDPRTVLLLPFWLRALRIDPIVVGIFRNPLEVADSLAVRDRMPKRQALRLWEAYNRALLTNARGLPAFIAAYEDLVGDCAVVAHELRTFLAAQGLTTHVPGIEELRLRVDADLRHNLHSASSTHTDGDMTEAQHELFRTLREARGQHSAFGELRDRFQPHLESVRPG
jgi:hypothetical protein